MINQWMRWINGSLVALILLFVGGTVLLIACRPSELTLAEPVVVTRTLPRNSFLQPQEAHDAIGAPLLKLNFAPPTVTLPDLKQRMVYHGTNGRPDLAVGRTLLHFGLNSDAHAAAVAVGDKLYLVYEKEGNRYVFSQEESSLWLEAQVKGTSALVSLFLKGPEGNISVQFTLPEREFARSLASNFEIGGSRVDGTLLARQRTRWCGMDKFLELHGGEEFRFANGKQRVDFGEKEAVYSLFLAVNDCLVWDGTRWQHVTLGPDSQGKPLLQLRKIDERLMSFDLFDPEGRSKTSLNLIKSSESFAPQLIERDFKFLGARTRSQCVFEVQGERVTLKPQDWLIRTATGWQKIDSGELIDDYVSRKLVGPLFVFGGVTKKEDKQILAGKLFNAARTDVQDVEIAVQQAAFETTVPKLKEALHEK